MGQINQSDTAPRSGGAPCPCSGENPCIPCKSPFCEKKLCSLPVAMTYTPYQKWNQIYDAAQGLARGTMFPELDLPFCGRELV